MTPELALQRKEYLLASLDIQNVTQEPLDQFNRWYKDALKAETMEPNAMVLSTAGLDGRVSARVVLLKGIEKGSFQFFSNYHSNKGLQLNSNPFAALTFHWKEIERQVRIEGFVKRLSRRQSNTYFKLRPIESRISACISPQSAVIPDRDFLDSMYEGFLLDLKGHEPVCPDNWGGYLLSPHLVEFWQGRANRLHDRLQYRKSGNGWILERLAP